MSTFNEWMQEKSKGVGPVSLLDAWQAGAASCDEKLARMEERRRKFLEADAHAIGCVSSEYIQARETIYSMRADFDKYIERTEELFRHIGGEFKTDVWQSIRDAYDSTKADNANMRAYITEMLDKNGLADAH